MRKAAILFWCVVALAAAFSGCVDKDKYKKELVRIDTMRLELKKISEETAHFDSMKVCVPIERVKHNLSRLDTLLPDTLSDKELAILLMEYRSVIRPLKQYRDRAVKIDSEAVAMSARLADLKNDLEKQTADEKQVPRFMETEEKNILSITSSFALLDHFMQLNLRKADSLEPIITGHITELTLMHSQKKK